MSPVTDLGSAGCDPSTPYDLPSPVLFQGGVHNPRLWIKTPKGPKSWHMLGMCLNGVLPAMESTELFLLCKSHSPWKIFQHSTLRGWEVLSDGS